MVTTVIVGASLAGLRTAEQLRRLGEDGPIVLVGAEAHPPYDRPPLSKKVLTDPDRDIGELTALPVADDLGIEWRLGTAATGLDLDRRRVTTAASSGATEEVAFDRLVVATGASARTLPASGADPHGERAGIHVLRTLDDAVGLRADLAGGPAVAVVGAGFIGLEVASSCIARGLAVTVVEVAPVPLERAVGPVVGRRIAERHRSLGATVTTGVEVEAVEGTGRVEALRLADGRRVDADTIVVGVGVAPNTAWLEGSGVDLDDGVVCDGRLRVLAGGRPVEGVVAAGDVVRWHRPGAAKPVRMEHWTNAVEQGEAAARTLVLGEEADEFAPVPYFWSDQMGVKLQMLGTTADGDEVAMLEDDAETGRWVAAYGRGGRLVAVLGASRPAKVMKLRTAIEEGAAWPPGPA